MRRSTVIVTPPAATALTTTGAVQTEFPSTFSSGDLSRVTALIDQASDLVTGYIGRQLARATVKDVFHGHHGHHTMPLVLSRLPVATMTSVLDAGAAKDLTTLDVDMDAGLIYLHSIYMRPQSYFGSFSTIDVTYDGGYILPGQSNRNLPYAIERACVDIVLALWYRSGRGDPMIRSETVEGIGSTSYLDPGSGYEATMPPAAAAALQPYCNYGT